MTWDQGINGLKDAQQGINTILEEYEVSELTEEEEVLFGELKKAKDETDKMSSKAHWCNENPRCRETG